MGLFSIRYVPSTGDDRWGSGSARFERQIGGLLSDRIQSGLNFTGFLFWLEILFVREWFSEAISMQVVESWEEGKVVVNGLAFTILEHSIMESLEKSMKPVKSGKGRVPLHQGMVKLLFQHEKDKCGGTVGPLRGGFLRTSGTPVSKAQLHLGPAPLCPVSNLKTVISDSEEEVGQKREGLPSSCERSTQLQKKLGEKNKVEDYVDSSEEEKDESDIEKTVDLGKSSKEKEPKYHGRSSAPESYGTNKVLEELKCHLKILNGLGGPLMSTCACINVLSLEITNYLKEVVNKLKELSSEKP
eukprot:Gb_27273 [translate_table: standard]